MDSSPPRLRHQVASETALDVLASRQQQQPSDGEINTLREVYKHTTTTTTATTTTGNSDSKPTASRAGAGANDHKKISPAKSTKTQPVDRPVHIPQPDYDTDVEPVAPPLPPKNFDINELEAAIKVLPTSEKPAANAKKLVTESKPVEKARKHKSVAVTSISVTSTVANPLFTQSSSTIETSNGKAAIGLKPSQLKRTNHPVSSSESSSTNESSKPYMIKNVIASNRRAKGTTVLIEGDSEARISTPPLHPATTPSRTQHVTVSANVRRSAAANTSTTAPGVASRMSSYVQAPVSDHPPFVAVARVGDSYNAPNSSGYNNGAVAHKISVDRTRAKIQSMYM